MDILDLDVHNNNMDILELDKQFKEPNERFKIKAILSFPMILKDPKTIDVGFTKLAEYWRQRYNLTPEHIILPLLDSIFPLILLINSLFLVQILYGFSFWMSFQLVHH